MDARAAGHSEANMPQYPIPLVIHAAHEAGQKLGGIGAVLDGMLTNRTRQIHSSIHGVNQAPETLAASFRSIEAQTHARLIYGTRSFGSYEHDLARPRAEEAAWYLNRS